jgi:hypothetical protein
MKHDDVETITQVYHSHFTNAASKYYVGIIDILQKWTWEKKLERWAKAFMGQDLDGVSAIEPDPYRQRFCEAVQGCVRYCFPVPAVTEPFSLTDAVRSKANPTMHTPPFAVALPAGTSMRSTTLMPRRIRRRVGAAAAVRGGEAAGASL